VFEGEITEVKLQELKLKAGELMDQTQDSLIIFKSRQARWLDKEVIGQERNTLDNIL
jgi:CRISPR-associated protein Cas2